MVDDHSGSHRILNCHLRPNGLEVVMAENGRHAVERGLTGVFEAILLDMPMPEVDVYSAARQLR